MFIDVIDHSVHPLPACWENDSLYWQGAYYAMFNMHLPGGGYAVNLHKSEDGVHWHPILEGAMPLPSAHAGYSFHVFGSYAYYHPTCTTPEKGIHFKTYRSRDMLNWEHMGDAYDVVPDPRWYRERWDELQVLEDRQNEGIVYYGYISSEARDDVAAPSCGLLKSLDGLSWEVLPPPVIHWGRIPAQHMEVSFCEKIGERYFLSLNGRLYLDSLGYSQFIFVADHPEGPFYPDEIAFKLCGNSNAEYTWLSHTIHAPSGLLCATWLSRDAMPSIPSSSFTVSPLSRLLIDEGHLRMGYWEGNDAAKGPPMPLETMSWAHPIEAVRDAGDACAFEEGTLKINASRDGVIALFDAQFDAVEGFVIEGRLRLRENRTHIETHHHAAWFGIYLEAGENRGTAIAVSTHAVGVSGDLTYSDKPIGTYGFVDDERAAQDLHTGRSGAIRGLIHFTCRDRIRPLGEANAPSLRHGTEHTFRFLARGDFFQLYVDNWYVQTYVMPHGFTGRIGLMALDGALEVSELKAWRMEI